MSVKRFHESEKFVSQYKRLDKTIRTKVVKLIQKIIENPTIGKPMRYGRKGTREVYLKPFRLSYAYDTKRQEIILLDLYHKKKQ